MKDGLMVASPPKRGTMAYLDAYPNQILTMSLEDYWELEAQNAYKSEFFQNKVTAIMPYTSQNHNDIITNLVVELKPILRQRQYKLYAENRPVWIAAARLNTYPDIFIVENSTIIQLKGKMTAETTPSVIIEVLSDSTESDDRNKKMRAYKMISTVQQIVLVHQNEPLIEIYTPNVEKEIWEIKDVYGLDKTATISGVQIDLVKIYAGIDFTEEA